MTEIMAIVRRKRASATKKELARVGCQGYTQFSVLGRGRQRGLRQSDSREGPTFLPKAFFDINVPDDQVAETMEAIIRANQTGEFGDGKIILIESTQAYRISTGQRLDLQKEGKME